MQLFYFQTNTKLTTGLEVFGQSASVSRDFSLHLFYQRLLSNRLRAEEEWADKSKKPSENIGFIADPYLEDNSGMVIHLVLKRVNQTNSHQIKTNQTSQNNQTKQPNQTNQTTIQHKTRTHARNLRQDPNVRTELHRVDRSQGDRRRSGAGPVAAAAGRKPGVCVLRFRAVLCAAAHKHHQLFGLQRCAHACTG